jgi:hypothetical protein
MSVIYKPFMLSVIMLNVVMQIVFMLSVVAPCLIVAGKAEEAKYIANVFLFGKF